MQTLLSDLLSLSRVSRVQEPFKVLNLRGPVEEAVDALTLTIGKAGGEVQVSDLPTIEAIPSQMRQLFQNLIGNALKFRGDKQPLVKIYSKPAEPGYCSISVEDNGIGFDEQFLEKMFRPFQRLHARSQYEGTGMGLAICKRIVERHRGSISARGTPGEGATFFVTLPVNQRKEF
jgi:light-regulated signal transduction histidine kinase (bacteriophytochrome)